MSRNRKKDDPLNSHSSTIGLAKNITRPCSKVSGNRRNNKIPWIRWQVLFWRDFKTGIGFWSFSFLFGKDQSQGDKFILGGSMEEGLGRLGWLWKWKLKVNVKMKTESESGREEVTSRWGWLWKWKGKNLSENEEARNLQRCALKAVTRKTDNLELETSGKQNAEKVKVRPSLNSFLQTKSTFICLFPPFQTVCNFGDIWNFVNFCDFDNVSDLGNVCNIVQFCIFGDFVNIDNWCMSVNHTGRGKIRWNFGEHLLNLVIW